ncbi:hypothetical protein [Halomonas sp. MCCC 1A11062]|uniref:ImmA/IrrE family metallo-endopeptidase n=1 Tax=Halomonas sp. MCCC 1A11062 TaxID=2733485 RepID=UPI001F251742|nr:hypothetical protein [Halomonas sp. MCCC 1A11062]MCE8038914.1 hypothetical protein [Halomonas sp. MCCC 1A11062]
MSMQIGARWLEAYPVSRGAKWESIADNATLAELELMVADLCLTRAEDTLTGGVRRHAVLAANRLAEWLVWNWWRLCYEPRSSGKEQVPGWFEAHRMPNVGGGWLWPNVEFVSDGVRMRISAKQTSVTAHQPLRYLSSDHAIIPLISFEKSADDFIEKVCERLNDQRVAEADLPLMWEELQAERADPELTVYRRLEALLGFDPDECPEQLIVTLHHDAALLGQAAVEELAAGAGNAVISASQLQEWAHSKGVASVKKDRLKWAGHEFRIDHQLAAWRNGVSAARTLRAQEKLDGHPITNRCLAEWFAVPIELLESGNHKPELAYELDWEGGQSRVLLRSKWETGRRFELARLLGDTLVQGTNERLHLATMQNTYRQKFQRAFAAELLCPIEPLKDVLEGDYTDDAIQGAADNFKVSPLMVTTQLVNNGVLHSDELNGLDQDLAVA